MLYSILSVNQSLSKPKTTPKTIMTTATMPQSILDILSPFQDEDGKISNLPREKLVKVLELYAASIPIKTRKSKAKRDPSKPKRPTSAYFAWLKENREEISKTFDGKTHEDGSPWTHKEKFGAIAKEAKTRWDSLGDEDKQPFIDAFKVDQQRYSAEMSEYSPPPKQEVSQDQPPAPPGWSGAFGNMYLSKTIKENGKNKYKTFKSFEDAVAAAMSEENCGGITKTKRGYSLRVGKDLNTSPSGEVSWIKGTYTPPQPLGTVSPAASPAESPTPDAAAAAESPAASPAESPVAAPDAPPKKKRGRPKGSKNKPKTPEPTPAPEPAPEPAPTPEPAPANDQSGNSDDSDSEDEMEVAEIEHNGKTYYHNTDTDQIFDPETSEEVGAFVDGQIQFQ